MSTRTAQMVETVNATARVGALFVSILLFAAMWQSDLSEVQQSEGHWLARRAGLKLPTVVAQQKTDERQTAQVKAATEIASLLDSQFVPHFSTVSFASHSFDTTDLPAGIAPGRYRVVDSAGTVSSLVVSDSMIGSQRPVVSRAVYTMHRDGVTLYFIRVEDAATEIASARTGNVR